MATWTPTDEYIKEEIYSDAAWSESINESGPRPDVNITYSLYRFVGEVDQTTGLVVASSGTDGVIWEKVEYGIDSDISDFQVTVDDELVSIDVLSGMIDSTIDAGMTPMMAQVVAYPEKDNSEMFIRGVISEKTTNESLYSYASDGKLYPIGPLTVDDYLTYELSSVEVDSLKKQFDLANESDYADEGNSSGIYEAQFSSYLDELAQELINHMGVLLSPVINFHKTKNKEITNKEISSLGEYGVSPEGLSVEAFAATDVEYNS
jgi:hypothetical protein